MGLDQYAYSTARHIDTPVDFPDDEDDTMIATWRKHPDLHGWMERLYRQRNGQADSFNVATVALTPEDLRQLRDDVKDDALPHTEGFFFGHSHDDYHAAPTLVFVDDALAEISKGRTVFYTSWW